jgi:antitoxin HicB
MKTLNDYMAMSYRMEIVEDKDEGGFVVSYPDLPGCITCGETVERAVANALDAKKAWIEAAFHEDCCTALSPVYSHIPESR